MAYSTKEQVRLILGGNADATPGGEFDVTPKDLSDAQVEYEIGNADAQIDLSLGRKYHVPLTGTIPSIVTKLSADIAAALCDLTFRGSREYANDSNPFRIRYQRALDLLERIAEGIYPIYNEGEEPTDTGAAGTAIVINPYPGDILLTSEVFPRGLRFGEHGEFAENIHIVSESSRHYGGY